MASLRSFTKYRRPDYILVDGIFGVEGCLLYTMLWQQIKRTRLDTALRSSACPQNCATVWPEMVADVTLMWQNTNRWDGSEAAN